MKRVVSGLVLTLALSIGVTAAESPIAEAAARGDREAVKSLLKKAADVNAAQGDGMTALHWAAMNGDLELAEMLIVAGANVRATTRLGTYTPLYLASRQGHASIIQALITAGADLKTGTPNGTTPLMVAAAAGEVAAVKVLIDHGADVNAKDGVRAQTPLMYAAASNLANLSREGLGFGGNPQVPGGAGAAPAVRRAPLPGVDRNYSLNELIVAHGGLTPLLYAVRQGFHESTAALLTAGADVNMASAGDRTTPLLMAIINGHFDLAKTLLERGADANATSDQGVSPLYGVLNVEWAPKALYPQPRSHMQQKLGYLELLQALIDKGADVNARTRMKVWYSGYSFDLSGVDEIGASVFWRAAYASDVAAMKMLVAAGADPNVPTIKPAGRARFGDMLETREVIDQSGLPPVPVGGPSVLPIHAAAGVGYGEGFGANSHRFAPTGMLAAVKYLVEELGADVNAADHEGNTALHHAAARGDNEMILYLVSKGANVKAVDREGRTTVDMANGPVQRIQPFPETIALLEKLGAKNNHKCISC
jgi:ankyrin repeat protein